MRVPKPVWYFARQSILMTETISRVFLFIALIVSGIPCIAEKKDPLNRPLNREILDNYQRKADEYVARNLNRFALDRLHVYDRLLDSLYVNEKKDTLAVIEQNYDSTSSLRISSIANLKKEIAVLSADKKQLESRFWKLVRYAIISFVIWLAIVIIFFRFRQSKLKKAENMFYSSSTQVETLENHSEKAKGHLKDLQAKIQAVEKLETEVIQMEKSVQQKKESGGADPKIAALVSRYDKLRKAVELEKRVIESTLEQGNPTIVDKVPVDINTLCDAYMEIAYRGVAKSETFKCTITRDFEKRLPQIKVNPSQIGTALLNILTNAFQSVKQKHDLGVKGYEPKVSISTRILPRFLQIRIRDNGIGMNEQLLTASVNEFYSTREVSEGTGLGLSIARNIIGDHKGEIKMESEEGNSTDVYIKFFT